jgi:hypothetical protein
MARWLALMAIITVGSGCTLKVPSGMQPNYDLTDYETYDQQIGSFNNEAQAMPFVAGPFAPEDP